MDSESAFLHSSISHINNKIETKQVILTGNYENEGNIVIPNNPHQSNFTLYIASFGVSNIKLPSAENFKNIGLRIIILVIGVESIQLDLASNYSHDSLLYNMEGYSDVYTDGQTSKTILNRGFVELMWFGGGWLVINSNGFTITSLN